MTSKPSNAASSCNSIEGYILFCARQWSVRKLLRLKEMVRSSLQSAEPGDEDAYSSLVLEMRYCSDYHQ